MPVKLYSLVLSHPSQAARLMLEHKGIDHTVKDLFPGGHPAQLRLAGFRRGTVPGLKIDGRRVQGSLDISRALEEVRVEPRLFPADPERRRADVASVPALLDRVDTLIAAGVISGDEPNAADFQIGTTIRVLLAYEDLRALIEGRPAADLAMRVMPRYPGPIPPFLPREWLDAAR